MAGWRGGKFPVVVVRICFLLGLFVAPASAQETIEKLLMPGPVSTAHIKQEDTCGNCHEMLSGKSQDTLCLDCHKPIDKDRVAGTGFHGRSKLMAGVTCSSCHTEHRGRDMSIVRFDADTFNHDVTDYPITGAHKRVDCEDCHVKGKKYAEAPKTCIGCHEKDQPHKGNLGRECEACHEISKWAVVAPYDHARTKFPLLGKHEKVACLNCHLGEVYKGLSAACNDCHAIQDVHEGRFGDKCETCHRETGWEVDKFDHGKSTKFELRGAHATAECQDCHHGDFTVKTSKECFSCHEKQDAHKATLGKNCADCHNETAWRANVIFDHGLTNFPLVGLHVIVACEECHETAVFQDARIACVDCHKPDDEHNGRFAAKCESCHSPNGWRQVSFDHDKDTTFKLTGAHTKTACYDCHKKENVSDAKLPATCISCHKADDVHRGAFGDNCARCHTTETFSTAFIRQ